MDAQPTPTCGRITSAVQLIGDKWSGLIIYELMDGPRRFCEIQHSLGIGPRTLSQRLLAMETADVVVKEQFAEVPPRVEYSLTEKGTDLLPVLQSMAEWCAKHPPGESPSH